jgi:hypothetical protein
MTFQFSGPQEGPTATYTWTGNKVGNGKLVITRSEPQNGVWYTLDFDSGKYVSAGGLIFEPAGDTTKVTWHNGGQLGFNPVNRYFGLLMDRLTGPDFASGLDNLKRIVEAKK